MQLKFKGLVAISIFTLIALISIQGYLIYNTYELKKKRTQSMLATRLRKFTLQRSWIP